MNAEILRNYCLNKLHTTESMPFNESTLVFKVGDKIFALFDIDNPVGINLKCEVEKSIELREQYPNEITAGYHMNKKHWITVRLDCALKPDLIFKLIDDSYQLVFDKLPQKVKNSLLI